MERYPLTARHPSSPSHVPLPEQTLHPTTLRLLPVPQLPARRCAPLLAGSLPPHAPACSHRGGCPAGAFGEGKQGVLERARDGGAVGKGNVANLRVQTAGLTLSFATCSPAPSLHKGSH